MTTINGSIWVWKYVWHGLSSDKKTLKLISGTAAYVALCITAILSLKRVRARYYQLFFISQ